ncbi:threonine/serine exporter family protein [Microvirga sp. W0021]|uniref:Threonine/serine exporter family protein n=1 Tax=Hohaiivirga grylli TaxID=3133970 RepID=A0ABV0BJD0_9HYPH
MTSLRPHSVVEVALKAAVLVHQSGGDAARTESTMRRVATALDVERVDTMVSSLSMSLTIKYKGEIFTGMRRSPHMGVNFRALTGMERALLALEKKRITLEAFERIVDKLYLPKPYYPPWVLLPCVGLACAGFAAMFLGDAYTILIAFIAGMIGMTTRYLLAQKHYKPFIVTAIAAFVATLIAGTLQSFTSTPNLAIAASVLFLIPGVPLINGASDMLNGSYLNALIRLTMGLTMITSLSLGMSVALRIVS